MFAFIVVISCWNIVSTVESAVLDPALYLSPMPPLIETMHGVSPGNLWSRSLHEKAQRDYKHSILPIEKKARTYVGEEESMDEAETFWPYVRTADYRASGVYIPLTFRISGIYGIGTGTKALGTGMVGNSYASVSGGNLFSGYGKSGLAGGRYGTYGSTFPRVRIHGGDSGPSWSGWGNGKWGHYGKG